MAKVVVNGTVLAESDEYEEVEGNIYFPPESVHQEYFQDSDRRTTCPWKGEAHYYDIVVGDEHLENAAWYYPEPKEQASHIKDHVAFYTSQVEVEE